MNANALRSILLVKSVEEHDPDGAVLPLALGLLSLLVAAI